MTDNEKLALIAHTVQYCAGRCKVIAGTGTNDTAHSLQLSRVAASMGADAVLMVTPYYNKCTQAGLIAHYTAAADTLPCPVIVYNVPSRTGVDVSVETCRVLAGHPNIGGIKEASGSVPKAAHILDACGDELPVWSGNDDLTVPLLSLGAKGVISVLSNVRPKRTLQMVRACQAGDYAAAGRMQVALTPLIDALFSEINPIPVKQALSLMGIPAGLPRLPLTQASTITRISSTGPRWSRHSPPLRSHNRRSVHHNDNKKICASSYSHCQQSFQHAKKLHISTKTRIIVK